MKETAVLLENSVAVKIFSSSIRVMVTHAVGEALMDDLLVKCMCNASLPCSVCRLAFSFPICQWVEVVPSDSSGKEYTEQDDKFIDEPSELEGKNVYFIVKLNSARGLPNRFSDIYCRYNIFDDEDGDVRTDTIFDSTPNPNFNHNKMFSFEPATKEVIQHLHDGWFVVQVWGKQQNRKSAALFAKGKTTKQMLSVDHDIISRSARGGANGRMSVSDPEKQSVVVELLLMKKQQARLQQRVDAIRRFIDMAEMMNRRRVPTALLKEVFNASSVDVAERVMAMFEDLSDEDSDGEDDDWMYGKRQKQGHILHVSTSLIEIVFFVFYKLCRMEMPK
uniref:C2 domain-containing protein n=1 Tax=Strigamia maritima TaxID=126957 RepID=T1ISP7_STRMM